MIEAGIYTDLSHQDYLKEDGWVSSSMLKRHLPEFYKPFSGSSHADLGSVFHARFTGDDTPVIGVDAATWTGKAAKDAQAEAWSNGHYAILLKDVDIVDGMEKAVHNHPEASRLLVDEPGTWETSVFAEVDGVPSKCRFDRLTETTAVDIKTTKSGPGPYALTRAVLDYGYDLAAAHYTAVGEAAGIPKQGFVFVFVSKEPPHHVTVVELDGAFWERGAALRDLALSRYLHPSMVESYPGETGRLELSLPRWAVL